MPSTGADDGASPVAVSAVMIVRDEEERLPRSLPPLLACCDEVVVADTGSTDGTVRLAGDLGARVVHVPWPGGFAEARNAAAAHARFPVVLVVDADEELVATREDVLGAAALLLRWHEVHPGGALVASVEVRNTSASAEWSFQHGRLYLPRSARYTGRAHERLRTPDGRRPETVVAPGIVLVHTGYVEDHQESGKAERNAELLAAELAETPADSPDRPWLLVDLGKSLLSWGRLEDALSCLSDAAGSDDPAAAQAALDFAARALIAAGLLAEALDVVDAYVAGTGDTPYAHYLYGQIAALAGDGARAVGLLSVADAAASEGRLVDGSGRVLGPRTVTPMLEAARELAAATQQPPASPAP